MISPSDGLGFLNNEGRDEERMRLDKMLSHLGLGSRKEVKQLLKARRVTVNGAMVKDGKMQVDEHNDAIAVDGEVMAYQAEHYFLLYKPQGVITATEDKRARTVMDCLDDKDRVAGLFPVGRLDKDTTGLLLLTTNGPLAHELLAPKKHVEKEYQALIEGVVTEKEIAQFKGGLTLDGGEITQPAQLMVDRVDGNQSWIRLIIHEGKFHQVKRMFQAVGMKVLRLHRLRMGSLVLGNLAEGQYRPLTDKEIQLLGGDRE